MNKKTCYVLVRKDLSVSQQIVQACHACLDLKINSAIASDNIFISLLGVKNQSELEFFASELENKKLKFSIFFEPDNDIGFSAICTEPLDYIDSSLFNKLQLWKNN